MKKNNNESTTSLSMLPDDQRQEVLSYLTCSEILTLTLVSKAVRCIALRSHTLIITNHTSINDQNHHRKDPSLRKSIVNMNNLEPMSSHPRQRRWTVSVSSLTDGMNRSSLNGTISSRSSIGMMADRRHHNVTTEENLKFALQRFQSLRVLKVNNLDEIVADKDG